MPEKILIVDDDLDTIRLVGLMLERQGYQIRAATSGPQALEIISNELPDLILLDLMMPEMDGITVARRLRATPETQDVLIIVFSAKNQREDVLECFDAGVDDYLTKPIQPRELIAHVKAVLKRAGTRPTPPVEEKVLRGRSIVVMSAKGGVGASTVAVNLGVAAHQLSRQKVVVTDFRPGSGTIGLDLGFSKTDGVNRLLRLDPSRITTQKVQAELMSHNSGADFLLAAPHPSDVGLLTSSKDSSAVDRSVMIFQRLLTFCEYLIVDIGSILLPVHETLAQRADLRLYVLDDTPSSIAQTRYLLAQFTPATEKTPSIIILVDRNEEGTNERVRQINQQLGREITTRLSYIRDLAQRSQSVHQPIVMVDPANELTQQYYRLAAVVTNALR